MYRDCPQWLEVSLAGHTPGILYSWALHVPCSSRPMPSTPFPGNAAHRNVGVEKMDCWVHSWRAGAWKLLASASSYPA